MGIKVDDESNALSSKKRRATDDRRTGGSASLIEEPVGGKGGQLHSLTSLQTGEKELRQSDPLDREQTSPF